MTSCEEWGDRVLRTSLRDKSKWRVCHFEFSSSHIKEEADKIVCEESHFNGIILRLLIFFIFSYLYWVFSALYILC